VRVTIIRVTMLWIVLLGVWLAATTAPAEARLSRRGQVGWASWYGSFHHGKPTATGEHFSMSSLTAAHRTLPLGTTVVVTNLRTRRQVALRINDRGPYVDPKRRIIDLSRAAARRLGFEHPGLAPVRLVVQKKASARSTRVPRRRFPAAAGGHSMTGFTQFVRGSSSLTACLARSVQSPFGSVIQVMLCS
jgi:rare lipoprotein A (peptidoglycan hydrolase)